MSQKGVVRRRSTNSRRKNNDSDRSDSGCFEDVDVLQMASRHCQPTCQSQTKDTADSDEQINGKDEETAKKRTNDPEVFTEAASSTDDNADDSEFRAILERLAEVTKNPGDLYRLCFSSRLSLCGLPLGGAEDEGSLPADVESFSRGNEPETVKGDKRAVEKLEHKNCGNRQQCVELLSLLSSFVEKAKENPSVFNQSDVGGALVGQLSSLVTILEEAKKTPSASVVDVGHAGHEDEQAPSSETRVQENKPLVNIPQPSADRPRSRLQLRVPSGRAELSLGRSLSKQTVHSELPLGLDAVLPSDSPDGAASSTVSDDDTQTSSVTDADNVATFAPDATNQCGDTAMPSNPDDMDNTSVTSSDQSPDDVISNGRRAVKPYSWDYGDIWEKELERAQSTDSFPGSNFQADKLMPCFEEIRDELFHDAGFTLDGGTRTDGPKRRSRSADSRSTLQSDPYWRGSFPGEQAGVHSPFVRTVYQPGCYPDAGLTRSRSSHHLGGNSITVNVDRAQGRQVRVFRETPDGHDDSWAHMIKEAVVATSTFRGAKPWAALKRRPSGLRRRANSSTRAESLRPGKSAVSDVVSRKRLNSHGDSESSDSPCCVSAASSDCLTTDDSSSVTSSHYCAASSVQSSPSVSNRNSACFSDAGSSDLGDLRRVVVQDSPPQSYPEERYTIGSEPRSSGLFSESELNGPSMGKWDLSLNQRFACMNRNSRAFSEPDDHRLKVTASNILRNSYQQPGNFRASDSMTLRDFPKSGLKYPRERLMTPLLVRSDSDLNRLTKVHFVGDSYSRSRISKNVRHVRKSSRSPSPLARATHTRVVSCEIVPSDKNRRDVYTKVNLSRGDNDDATNVDDYVDSWAGRTNTRRSWHGHSPTRGFSRSLQAYTKPSPRRGNSERRACPTGLVDRRREIFRAQEAFTVDKPVHAKLVEVKNMESNNSHPRNTTGRLRSSWESDESRNWSDYGLPSSRRGYTGMRCNDPRQAQRNVLMNRSGNFTRAKALFERSGNSEVERQRLAPDQLSTVNASRNVLLNGARERGRDSKRWYEAQRREVPRNAKFPANFAEKACPVNRNSPLKTNGGNYAPKDPVPHIVKETSFVGPSTFTKYQSPSSPSLTRGRRSKSFNEDSPSRRRTQEPDMNRHTAEIRHGEFLVGRASGHPLASKSDTVVVRRPERGRRYSEGAWRPPRANDSPSECVVDESYCDPRRDSIREGTYSIVSAESARYGTKWGESRPKRLSQNDKAANEELNKSVVKAKKIDQGTVCVEQDQMESNRSEPEKSLSDGVVKISSNAREDIASYEKHDSLESSSVGVDVTENKNSEAARQDPSDPAVSPEDGARETPGDSKGISICIDYRNKRPVSVEYSAEEVPQSAVQRNIFKFESGKKGKTRVDNGNETKNKTAPVVAELPKPRLVGDLYKAVEVTSEEFPRKRMSRRDRHEQEMLSNAGKEHPQPKEEVVKLPEVLPELPSPVPYRRDKFIHYTDARSSLDSDADSISHDSTISSSGSDVTVVLNDDQDISAEDLRQLAQNSSEIGIEIGPLELDSSDDLPDNSDSTPEKARGLLSSKSSPTLPDWNRMGNLDGHPKSDGLSMSCAITALQESEIKQRLASSSETFGKNRYHLVIPEETGIEGFTCGSFRRQNDVNELLNTPEEKNSRSSSSSIASSRESSKGGGSSSSESFKGKHSEKSTEGGKGFFSRLRSIRNSFRGKKSVGKSKEKSGRRARNSTNNAGKTESPNTDIRVALGSRSLPIFDSNSNEVPKFMDRNAPAGYSSKLVRKEVLTVKDDRSRRSYESTRQSGDGFRNVAGVKSISSDHLNSYRVNRPSSKKVSAKSLEALVETCI